MSAPLPLQAAAFSLMVQGSNDPKSLFAMTLSLQSSPISLLFHSSQRLQRKVCRGLLRSS